MAANINGSLRVAGQVLNLKPENLGVDPTGGGLVESRLWYNTVSKAFKFYNGTAVVDLAAGGISQEDLETALLPYAETTDVNSAITAAITDLVSGTEMQNAIDNALAGLDFQADVLGLEGDYVATPGRYIFVDGAKFTSGVAAAAGDIVTVDAAGVILTVAYDVSAAGPGALAWNRAGVEWLRWNGTDWAEFGGLTGFTAGDGIEKTGDVVSVKLDGASLTKSGAGLKVGDLSATYVTPAAQTTAINTAVSGLQSAAQVAAAITAAVADFQDADEVNTAVLALLVDYAKSADVTTEISTAVTGLASTVSVNNAIANALSGLDFQADVLGLETDYAGVAGRYIMVNGLSGITAVASNTNDIVTADGAGQEVSLDYDVSDKGPGALVWNRAASMFMRWNGTTWAEFGGLTGFTAGDGIEKTGDVVSVKADGASITVGTNGIKVGDLSATYVTPAALATATADFLVEADVTPLATAVNNVQTQLGASFFAFSSGATSATTHTITHNLNYQWPIVQLVDPTTNQIITADSVEFTSANELVVTLSVAATLRASISWLNTTP
jgi:hypothetical protein